MRKRILLELEREGVNMTVVAVVGTTILLFVFLATFWFFTI